MAKRKRREKSLMEYEVEELAHRHAPRAKMPHVASEMNDAETRLDLTRNLTARARRAVLGQERPRKVHPAYSTGRKK